MLRNTIGVTHNTSGLVSFVKYLFSEELYSHWSIFSVSGWYLLFMSRGF